MTLQSKFKNSLTSLLVCLASVVCIQTSVAQVDLDSGLVVTASDNAVLLGQTLFPQGNGSPFQFDSASLDFGLEGLPFATDPDGNPIDIVTTGDRIPAESLPTIGTFVNSSAVYGIGDPANTVATGIAISSGLVENYGGGPNFTPSQTGSFGTFEVDDSGAASGVSGPSASDEQTSLLGDLSPAAGGVFQDTTSLSINFTNVAQTDQVLDLFAVFGTEETPESIGTNFNDAFGVFLNGENIALQNGLPLNVDHPNHRSAFGTELDTIITAEALDGIGVPLPYVDLTTTVGTGQHNLTIVLGDASDDFVDSTAFLSRDVTAPPVGNIALLPTSTSAEGNLLFEDLSAEAGEAVFIDPEIATGYEYSVEELPGEAEALFGTVRVDPAGFDTNFTISYVDENGTVVLETVIAGETFVFPESADVSSFEILDIDQLDPLFGTADSPLAFAATLLTFRNDLNGATVVQVPISAVPEPSSVLLLLAGSSITLLRRRR
jgi:hypothetical protein